MRNMAKGVLAFIVASAMSCASAKKPDDTPEPSPEPAKTSELPEEWIDFVQRYDPLSTYELTDKLSINTNAGIKRVSLMSEQEGIESIRDIIEKSDPKNPLEEAWAFIPSLDLWVEVGFGERVTRKKGSYKVKSSTVAGDLNYIDDLAKAFGEIKIYHPHPTLSPDGNTRKFYESSFPSAMDIKGVIFMHAMTEMNQYAININHALVSQFGVTSYNIIRDDETKFKGLLKDKDLWNAYIHILQEYEKKFSAWKKYAKAQSETDEFKERIDINTFKFILSNPAVPYGLALAFLETFPGIKTDYLDVSFTEHETTRKMK